MGTAQKKTVRAAIAAVNAYWSGEKAAGDAVSESLSPAVVLEIIGATPLSGSYKGWGQIREVLAATLRPRLRSLTVGITELIGGDDKIAAMISLSGMTADGRPVNAVGDPCGALFVMDGAKIAKIRLFIDTIEIETLLFGRRFAAADDKGQIRR